MLVLVLVLVLVLLPIFNEYQIKAGRQATAAVSEGMQHVQLARAGPAKRTHLGAAVDAGAQAQRDEALQDLRQLAVLQMVVEHARRSRVAQQIHITLLQPRRGEAPVPLRRPLRTQPRIFLKLRCSAGGA